MGAQFYREHLAAGGVDGIPKGSLATANLLTDAGVQGSARRYQGRQAFDEGRAAYAVNMSLAQSAKTGKLLKLRNNAYSRAIAQSYYGMGDGEDFDATTAGAAFTPDYQAPAVAADAPINFGNQSQPAYYAPTLPIAPPSPGGSSSQWASVLNSSATSNLFSGIGAGLSRLIGGQSVPQTSLLPTKSSAPSLTTMLMIGGLLAGAGYFLFKKSAA